MPAASTGGGGERTGGEPDAIGVEGCGEERGEASSWVKLANWAALASIRCSRGAHCVLQVLA